MDSRPSQRPTNAVLIDQCLHGQQAAWQELIKRYANLVHSVPVRYGLSPMEVDDIGQEVFLILAQSLHQIDDPERLPAWLMTTTRRVTWRAIQKRRREQPGNAAEFTEEFHTEENSGTGATSGQLLSSSMPTMQEVLQEWIHQEALQAGMERLEDRCRQLLSMLFLDPEEPSYDEISARLEMPLGSIGPTRNRCLRKLRDILAGLGFTDLL